MVSWSGRSIVGPAPIGSHRKISFLLDRAEQYQPSLLLTGLGSKSLLLIGQSVRQLEIEGTGDWMLHAK
jgi:hypothetical protein